MIIIWKWLEMRGLTWMTSATRTPSAKSLFIFFFGLLSSIESIQMRSSFVVCSSSASAILNGKILSHDSKIQFQFKVLSVNVRYSTRCKNCTVQILEACYNCNPPSNVGTISWFHFGKTLLYRFMITVSILVKCWSNLAWINSICPVFTILYGPIFFAPTTTLEMCTNLEMTMCTKVFGDMTSATILWP